MLDWNENEPRCPSAPTGCARQDAPWACAAVGDARAAIVDAEMTMVVDGDLVKVMAWYDNEWGYASQMVREALALTGGR